MRPPSRVVFVALLLALPLALATGASAVPADVHNPGFESFPAGMPTVPSEWVAGGSGTFIRDQGLFHTGAASLQLTTSAGGFSVNSNCFPVSASTTYHLSYWYSTADTVVDTVRGSVLWWTNASCTTFAGTQLDAIAPATIDPVLFRSFHLVQGSGSSPAGATHAYVQLNVTCDSGTLTCVSNYDDVLLDTAPITAVTVSSLAARRSNGAVDLTWRAGATADTLGFNVWRSASRTRGYAKLNRSLIAARGTAYRYRDRTARPGTRYLYRLQIVRLDGSRRWAGTVAVSALRR